MRHIMEEKGFVCSGSEVGSQGKSEVSFLG